jgi:hypothetical protein
MNTPQKDEFFQKHLPRMFSLIKNESWGLKKKGLIGEHPMNTHEL